MPRMSLDDRAARDPRVAHLAKLQGWSLRETRGCLAFEVWPLCYDRATPYLRRIDLELATGSEALAQNMIAAGLAVETRHGLRIAGASERVEYLLRSREAGRRGGKASGKSRASNEPLKGARTNPPGSTNPSASASASASPPDLALAPVPDPAVAPARARGPRKSAGQISLPASWIPTPEHVALASERRLDLALQAKKFRAHADAHDRRCVRWNAAFSQWLLGSHPERNGQSNGTRNADLLDWQLNRVREAEEAERLAREGDGT